MASFHWRASKSVHAVAAPAQPTTSKILLCRPRQKSLTLLCHVQGYIGQLLTAAQSMPALYHLMLDSTGITGGLDSAVNGSLPTICFLVILPKTSARKLTSGGLAAAAVQSDCAWRLLLSCCMVCRADLHTAVLSARLDCSSVAATSALLLHAASLSSDCLRPDVCREACRPSAQLAAGSMAAYQRACLPQPPSRGSQLVRYLELESCWSASHDASYSACLQRLDAACIACHLASIALIWRLSGLLNM